MSDEFTESEEYAQALRDDQRFGAEIAAHTREIAVNENDMERHREKLIESLSGWVTLDLPVETKRRLVERAEDADMTVVDTLEHLIATAPRVYSVKIPHDVMEKGRAHWPGLPDDKVIERMVAAGAARVRAEMAARQESDD